MVGVYRMRLIESFSPRYWIETVIFLPSRIIQYLGGKSDSLFAKLLQILYWIFTPLLIAVRDKIYVILAAFMEYIQKII